ncbi:MAG TPA: dihydropteroate synthase [Steroidobacteraceae bacterium]|jgi:dihydropteroate synthase|nr:dihydropteroate synthase [Steroidobacteraceae bacterium]
MMQLRCGSTLLDLTQPKVMGVLNVTPDSFSDGGRYVSHGRALEHAQAMVEGGAAIIDVGGESTRPGAAAVSIEEELRRVIPVVERLARDGRAIVSVDTSTPEVILAATAAGATLINDVRGLQRPGALEAAAASRCAVCIMHMQGQPDTMQARPQYADVIAEVKGFLQSRVAACEAAGIARDCIVVDPGFGFGKTVAHNLALVRQLSEFLSLRLPVLIGMSRKSTIGVLTGRADAGRLAGSLALAVAAVLRGAHIIRAHDVAETVDALKVAHAIQAGV